MAGSFTNAYEAAVLDYIYGGGSDPRKTTLYFALYTSAPGESSSGTEVTTSNWTNYARVAVTNNGTNFPTGSSKSNATAIDWGTATVTSGTVDVVAIGILDALTSGNLLSYTTITTKSVANGVNVSIPIGQLTLTLD